MDFSEFFQQHEAFILPTVRIIVLVLIGFPLVFFVSRLLQHRVSRNYTPHHSMLAGKAVLYVGLSVIVVSILQVLGFPLAHLLGAAGIVSVAIGFASQTSLSNLISGLFLIGEKPFSIGDIITVDGNTGEVFSIDALSVKMRCFDNKFVRIPNETLIKTNVINVTRFPLRRVDLNVGVAYKSDMEFVKEVLIDEAKNHHLVLDYPEPVFVFSGFGASSIDILFGLWVEKKDFLIVKNEMMIRIKKRLDQEGIEIPFPHLSLYTGSTTDPFPLQVQRQQSANEQERKSAQENSEKTEDST